MVSTRQDAIWSGMRGPAGCAGRPGIKLL